jgi:putative Ca2+/H+ antiporter (TMEM165/GDT1 family)
MSSTALFFYVFVVIFVAELPDKTALAALVLATRHRPWPVLVGTGLALTIQSLVAVAAGQLFALLPARPVHIAAGIVFLASAVVMWVRKQELPEDRGASQTPKRGSLQTAALVFGIVFVAEWGDLTQIVTAAFAAQYRSPVVVLASSTLALWAVAALAVFVGNRAASRFNARVTQRVAAILFALVGVVLLAQRS